MELADIEGEALALYQSAGLDPSEPARPSALAQAILGPAAIVTVHAASMRGHAALVRVRDQWRIYVRRSLPVEHGRFGVAHELAEWHLRRTGYTEPDVEDVADQLAAALIAPRPAWRRVGGDWARAAATLRTTESLVALRHGEVTGEPLALVARRLRVRGEPYAWPSEATLQAVAAGRKVVADLHRRQLEDDRQRAVVTPSA